MILAAVITGIVVAIIYGIAFFILYYKEAKVLVRLLRKKEDNLEC